MRRTTIIVMICLLCDATLSQATELSGREKALVKTIIGHSFQMRIHLWQQQSPKVAETNLSTHPFTIALSNAKDKEQKLLEAFNALPKRDRLVHAQALAYLGNDTGIAVLKEAAFPTKPMGTYMTSSGFEISESALCLLYLGFDFPDTFMFSKVPNCLYAELDVLLKK